MAIVRIPPVLRPSTGGAKEVEAAGENVGDVLRSLADQHPDTQAQLFAGGGELNRYVNVYLNDEDVRVLEGPRHGGRGHRRHRDPAGDGGRLLTHPRRVLAASRPRSSRAALAGDGHGARADPLTAPAEGGPSLRIETAELRQVGDDLRLRLRLSRPLPVGELDPAKARFALPRARPAGRRRAGGSA